MAITWIRNRLFDNNVLKSIEFDVPVISVGNIAVGGTGKTPMIEYLISVLQEQGEIGVLSRGYKRKSTGFKSVELKSTATEIGDEPLQIKQNFPECDVAVCEKRVDGVINMMAQNPELSVILLDDAFQHRAIKPSISLLLTTYQSPFTKDYILPMGKLREIRKEAKRADAIIVTKCPHDATKIEELHRYSLPVFYSNLSYVTQEIKTPVVGFSGLANNSLFKDYLDQNYELDSFYDFADHHPYTSNQIKDIEKNHPKSTLVCTQKDWAKIKEFEFNNPIHVIPIKTTFKDSQFKSWILSQLTS